MDETVVVEATFLETVFNKIVFYWDFSMTWVFPAFFLIAVLFTLHTLYKSFVFNYKYYIQYGEMAWWISDNSKDTERRREIYRSMGTSDQDIADIDWGPWLGALLLSGIFMVVSFAAAAIWPITILIGTPRFLIPIIARMKRKKAVFQGKLAGEDVGDK